MSTEEVAAPRRRRPRGSLSREEILDAAREIVEREGLRQLSMPVLAAHLKSGVTSIYWYFRNKDALVDALAQQVLSDVHQQLPPSATAPGTRSSSPTSRPSTDCCRRCRPTGRWWRTAPASSCSRR